MKIYLLTDLEGPTGVNGRSDGIGNDIINESASGEALVNEVNACIEGLLAGGVTEVMVVDGHGGSNSIVHKLLHPRATFLQLGGMAPVNLLDASFDAAVQIGAHAMQGSSAYMNHTFSSHSICEMRINGRPIGEIGVSALMASYFGVPTVLVSGDRNACEEAKNELGSSVRTVETKKGLSRYTAINRPIKQVIEELKQQAELAVAGLSRIKPLMAGPYVMDLEVMSPNQAFVYEMHGAERTGDRTIRITSDDIIDLLAQYQGWAKGVHNRKFNVTPTTRDLYC